jgi:N6-L-threonylcarbamoyladenine synthase
MLVLGIETSCDDTAVAIVENGTQVIANVVSSQDQIHAVYGGVVPELACRSHVEQLRPVLDAALAQAQVTLDDIDMIGVTQGPGLVGALLVGLSFAKALAYGTGKPLVPVHHLEGHISSIYLEHDEIPYPFVALVVSGGHSDLYLCGARGRYQLLGRTRDDAAGECFDKVAKMLHLGYPGGPIIDKLAQTGNPEHIHFPRAMMTKDTFDFSFSGVKTAVRTHLLQLTAPDGEPLFQDDSFWPIPEASWWEAQRNDILASFQQAVADVLVAKTLRAVQQSRALAIAVVGGVACNSALRQTMQQAAGTEGLPVYFPSPRFCTDNAAMIACAATYRYQTRVQADTPQSFLDLDAHPNLALTGSDIG